MSDTDNVKENEVEQVEPTQQEVNLGNFVDAIAASNFNQAKDLFDDMLNHKMTDAMEAEKVAVASNIFNGGEPSEEEVEEYDVEYNVEAEADDSQTELEFDDEEEVEDLDLDVEETEEETEVEES